ncbi:DJ-1/PfpI family protein [Vibrio furnissii]|uniref:DJ-1/PfpI family protein n=1 Tax=Vibrio furnissii TaxID=29494 RepID=UPI001EEC7E9C|nr:DJ-1/PfpI family protein [Vibrio furnissii]MCG6266532.1 DJ-1/PfpI family protein [Vibrio furnissii]
MTIRAALLLAQGFEDAEAIMTLDILNRLGIEVDTISCETSTQLKSYHHVTVVAKRQIDACLDEFYDAIILPGGPEGTQRLAACSHALNWIAAHDHQQKIVAALCSAPARVLGGNQLLKGRHYVCSGDLWQHCTDGSAKNRCSALLGTRPCAGRQSTVERPSLCVFWRFVAALH